MKDVMKLIAIVLGGISAVFGILGGVVMLRTWWIIAVILFVLKIVLIVIGSAVALSWWAVIFVPVGMFFGGLLLVAVSGFLGVVMATILEDL